jgi:NADPH:quinone reductase-like Zn-dependent oxidoreductase
MGVAMVATGFGDPGVLEVVEEQARPPGRGEVSIRVQAAGVNPIDYKLYSGAMGSDPSSLPLHLGQELCGVVSAVGEAPVGPEGALRVGEEVIAYRRGAPGAYASEVTWPATVVVPKPPSLDWQVAAGLLLVGTTAVHALSTTDVGGGDTVLIHGVSGGVGLAAAQLARRCGAEVIGTAGPARHENLRGYGIAPVAYGPGLTERVQAVAPDGVQAAIDAVGTDEAIEASLDLVPDRSRIATVVALSRGNQAGIHTLGGAPGATDAGTEIRDQAWADLISLATEGSLAVPIAATFPLSEASAAHELVAAGHAGGKVILLP